MYKSFAWSNLDYADTKNYFFGEMVLVQVA